MNLSVSAFQNARATLLCAAALMLFGAISYFQLPTREDPELVVREAVVTTRFPGMSAERVERLITKPLEEAIVRVPEVEEIRSVSLPGVSIIRAKVADKHFGLRNIWTDLRNKVNGAVGELPEGTLPPVVNDDFGDVAVVTAALLAPDFDPAEVGDVANHVRDVLVGVPGTKRVDLIGLEQERVYIEVSDAKLKNLGITLDQLSRILAEQNIISSGGEIQIADQNVIIEPSGNFQSVDDVRALPVQLPGSGGFLRLGDFAEIRRMTVDTPFQKAYFNGAPAVIIAISMQKDGSVLEYGQRVKSILNGIEETLPVGFSIEIATFQAEQVANAVYGVSWNALQTLLIVLGVVIGFLGLRTGLIVGAIVPIVMLITFAVMSFAGMTLERMSLATLVIALGLLVDNAIVVAEDFKRRLEEGVPRNEALVLIGKELTIPLLTSTLTTILVFLPLMMAQHSAGEYTRSISLVIMISLTASWLLAITVIPILCHRFIRVGEGANVRKPNAQGNVDRWFAAMDTFYGRALRVVLAAPKRFLAVMVIGLVVALAGMALVPQRFFPNSDRAQLLVNLDLPSGSSSRATDDAVRRVSAILGDKNLFPHIRNFTSYVGFGGPRFVLSLTPMDPAPNKGFIVLNLDDIKNLPATEEKLRSLLPATFPDFATRVAKMFLGPSDSSRLEYLLSGPDADFLYTKASELQRIFASIPGSIEARNDWENRSLQIDVEVDQLRARSAGVSSADIGRTLQRAFSGEAVSEFREGDDIFPVVLRAPDSERFDLDALKSLTIQPLDGSRPISLLEVADVNYRTAFSRIHRQNLHRSVTVEVRHPALSAEDMEKLLASRISAFAASLPPGFTLVREGVVKDSSEGQAALTANVPLCIGAIFLILVWQFNSFRRAAIVFLTLPFMLIGVVAGLLLFQENFGFMIILGLYALAGILMNNGIVLIDRIDIEMRERKAEPLDIVVSACVRRLRPIIMATVTTVVGLAPLIVFRDVLFSGMAAAMGGGMIVGTILTLGLVPILYALFFRVGRAQIAVGAGREILATRRTGVFRRALKV